MTIPQDIAVRLSKLSASTLTQFLDVSAVKAASPQDAEDRLFASLALTLSRRGFRQ